MSAAGVGSRAPPLGASAHTFAFPAYATIVLAIALILWVVQRGSLSTPCVVVPECPWPRLGWSRLRDPRRPGFRAAGIGGDRVAGLAHLEPRPVRARCAHRVVDDRSATAIPAIPLGHVVTRSLSAVPTDAAVQAVLRTIVIGAWFAVFATFPTGTFRPRWVSVAVVIAVCWTVVLHFRRQGSSDRSGGRSKPAAMSLPARSSSAPCSCSSSAATPT